jgi:putative membrane protein
MVFGLVGMLIVLPNVGILSALGDLGSEVLAIAVRSGGTVYILLGFISMALYGVHSLGMQRWLVFSLPAITISLASELLGTSTGFPFGSYHYTQGLGYKIAGFVPFTVPLSWCYMGLACYLIAGAGLRALGIQDLRASILTVLLGAFLLTAWDFALDPGMSQSSLPFWIWDQPGPIFGMPWQNFLGWFGTAAIFMGAATLLWRRMPQTLPTSDLDLTVPMAMYVGNTFFAAGMSLGTGFFVPTFLGLLTGVLPCLWLWVLAARPMVLATYLPPAD